MFYFLIIIFAVCFLFLGWRQPRWGLYLILALLPSYLIRFQLGGVPMTLLELMILLLFVVWFIKSIFQPEIRPHSKFAGAAMLILLIATVSMFLAPDLIRAAGIWKAYFLEAFLFFVVFSGVIKSSADIKGVIKALGVGVLLVSIFAIIQKLAGGWLVPIDYWLRGEGPRVTSFYGYPNAIGLFVAPVVMLHIGWLYNLISDFRFPISDFKKSEIRNQKLLELVFLSLVIICGMLAIYWARSEGAIIALIIGLIVFGLFVKKTRWITAGVILVAVILMLVLGLPSVIGEKITFSDWSGQVRLTMWGETWQLIKDNWLVGVGLTGYQNALVPYHQADYLEIFLYPHNFVLNFWVELGLAGLVVFLYLIFKFFYYGIRFINQKSEIRNQKLLVATLIAVMMVILVHGLVDVPYFKNDLAILWWVIFGLMSVLTYGKEDFN